MPVELIEPDGAVLTTLRMIIFQNRMYTNPRYSTYANSHVFRLMSITDFNQVPWRDATLTEVSRTILVIHLQSDHLPLERRVILMHHGREYQSWIANVHINKLWKVLERATQTRRVETRIAVLMSLHPRLGENSPLNALGPDLIEILLK